MSEKQQPKTTTCCQFYSSKHKLNFFSKTKTFLIWTDPILTLDYRFYPVKIVKSSCLVFILSSTSGVHFFKSKLIWEKCNRWKTSEIFLALSHDGQKWDKVDAIESSISFSRGGLPTKFFRPLDSCWCTIISITGWEQFKKSQHNLSGQLAGSCWYTFALNLSKKNSLHR